MSAPLLIVCTARSGSTSLADALNRAGVPCGHEEAYRLTRKPQTKAEVSWWAVPFLDRPVVHLWRDAELVVPSLMRQNFPWASGGPGQFVRRHMPIRRGPEQAAWDYWVEWTRRIRRWAFLTVTIEDLSPLEDYLGVRLSPRVLNASKPPQSLQDGSKAC